MRLRECNFPHPVVGHRNDVPDAGFQVSVKCRVDPQYVYFTAEAMCGSDTLLDLIETGGASYHVHVECGRTMYRQSHRLRAESDHIVIDAQHLVDEVEVVPFVLADRDVAAYAPDGMHADYGDATWDVSKGDILAVGDANVFNIRHRSDLLSRVGSLLQIERGNERTAPVTVELNAPRKIVVRLSTEDYDLYQRLRANPAYADQLSTSLVMPALMEAVGFVEQAEDAGEPLPEWGAKVRERLNEVGVKREDALIVKAQRILEPPIHRTLVHAEESASRGND